MKLRKFYRPNIINISLTLICLGLVFKLFVPLFSFIRIIPCRIFDLQPHMGLCPINPDPGMNTYYLGFVIGDYLYQVLYLVFIVAVLPYTLSCTLYHLYHRFIKGEVPG